MPRADHRRRAVVEHTLTELKSRSGAPGLQQGASAAWLTLAVKAHNLGLTVGQLAGPDLERATAASLRPQGVRMPAVHKRPMPALRLPAAWRWANPVREPS
jgi:hypothetical protein